MKTLTVVAVLAGLIATPFILRRCRRWKMAAATPPEDSRYSIDDFLGENEL